MATELVRTAIVSLMLFGCTSPSARSATMAPVARAPSLLSQCTVNAAPGTHVVTCDGLRYDVTIPDACANGGCGLVVDIHGLGMTARMEDASTHMRALGRANGYVIVQPTANPAQKERGYDLPNVRWPVWQIGDEERVFAFVEGAIASLAIDRARVHATGFSMGGMMTWGLLCKHADVFASVAPASGTFGCSFVGGQRPSREVPILYLHGHKDRLVPFYAANERRKAVVNAWGMHEVERVQLDDRATLVRYASKRGTPFVFVEHDYTAKLKIDIGGHCFPGSDDPGTEPDQLASFACEGPNAFVWGELVMEFFRAHPKVG